MKIIILEKFWYNLRNWIKFKNLNVSFKNSSIFCNFRLNFGYLFEKFWLKIWKISSRHWRNPSIWCLWWIAAAYEKLKILRNWGIFQKVYRWIIQDTCWLTKVSWKKMKKSMKHYEKYLSSLYSHGRGKNDLIENFEKLMKRNLRIDGIDDSTLISQKFWITLNMVDSIALLAGRMLNCKIQN